MVIPAPPKGNLRGTDSETEAFIDSSLHWPLKPRAWFFRQGAGSWKNAEQSDQRNARATGAVLQRPVKS
jgi:hypothetical protein